ncbi:hypothetical protein Sru01_41830 [Sphaerisporangium rufum]|uniref:SRPBCC family protein n=1 Tax=Sphaerisporangium rufum TaxID=1381558 RepID=A0A919R6B2_9ACTN|nr:SRPBCC family protein [Sphaerisporangium rufum]GII79201.1 hypothetical protein Sru01_41830 [Sphaerisporangium rufum]
MDDAVGVTDVTDGPEAAGAVDPLAAVTGAHVEVEATLDLPPERVWELVTDVARVPEWSPECWKTEWLDGADGGVRAGRRFAGSNRRQDREWTVTCLVTEADAPRAFGWSVLDRAEDPERPSSRWRYELAPAGPGRTLVRHSFVHGPGESGLREMMRANREIAAIILEVRLGELRRHMTDTLQAMTRT